MEGEQQKEKKKASLRDGSGRKKPGFLSSVFPGVCSAGEEKIKVKTLRLKLGTVEDAEATVHTRIDTHRVSSSS